MKSYDLDNFSLCGREPLVSTYVRQAEYLIESGKAQDVNVQRLMRMLHFCVEERLDAEPVLVVLENFFDSRELRNYCEELGVWKDACRDLDTLVGDGR